MELKIKNLTLIVLFSLAAVSTHAENVLLVVVNKDTDAGEFTLEQIRDVFFKKHRRKASLTPLDRDEKEIKANFYRAISHKSLNRVRAYWAKQVFTSRGRPPESFSGKASTVRLMREPQAVTYMRPSELTDALKIIYRIALNGDG